MFLNIIYFLLFLSPINTLLAKKIKMVIDTDGVSDDVRAISMALQHPKVDVLAITTVSGSATATQSVSNVARTLRANRVKSNIPVCKGAEESLIGNINTTVDVVSFFGYDGMSDKPLALPQVIEEDKTSFVKGLHASEALVSLFKKNKNEIVLVAIGPLTNLALALELNPEFANWPKRLVITGGNIYGMGNIRTSSSAEYNFNSDPEAASIVLQKMNCPITIVAWETTFFFQDLFDIKFDYDHHLNLNYPLANFFKAATEQPRKVMAQFGKPYRYCDEIAIALAVDPSIVTRNKNISVAVELHGSMTRGQLVVGWLEEWIGKSQTMPMTNVQLVLDYDVSKVDQMLIDAIKNVPHVMGPKNQNSVLMNKIDDNYDDKRR